MKLHPGANFLAHFWVGYAEYLYLGDFGIGIEEFLDLAWVDILATADHHIFNTANHLHIAVRIHDAEVAGVQPVGGIDGFPGALVVIPVTLHDRIAAHADFPFFTHREDAIVLVGDFYLYPGHRFTDGAGTVFQGVVWQGDVIHRTGFGLPVGDQYVPHVHITQHTLHHLGRARCAGHDAGAQAGEVEFVKFWAIQLPYEHGRDAVQAGALLVLHGLQSGQGIESVIGVNCGGAA